MFTIMEIIYTSLITNHHQDEHTVPHIVEEGKIIVTQTHFSFVLVDILKENPIYYDSFFN